MWHSHSHSHSHSPSLVLLLFLCLFLSLPSAYSQSCPCISRPSKHIVFLLHGDVRSDPTYHEMMMGAAEWGKKINVKLETKHMDTADVAAHYLNINDAMDAQLRELAARPTSQRPNAIITSVPSVSLLTPRLQALQSLNISIYTINSGPTSLTAENGVPVLNLPSLLHIGQDEPFAASSAAQRLFQSGSLHALCIMHQAGNNVFSARCQMFCQSFEKLQRDGLNTTCTTLQVDGSNAFISQDSIITLIKSRIGNGATISPSNSNSSSPSLSLSLSRPIDAILTLSPSMARLVTDVITSLNIITIKIATYDVNTQVTSLLESSKLFFAIDQQPYLQGALSVALMSYYLSTGQMPTQKFIRTGPNFISSTLHRQNNIRNLHYDVIVHGLGSDGFWLVFKNGVVQGAKDIGLDYADCTRLDGTDACQSAARIPTATSRGRVWYHAPGQEFDLATMSSLLDRASSAFPSGIVVSIPNTLSLTNSISNAVRLGISMMSANSGADDAQTLGMLSHVGMTEYNAGYGAGTRMASRGVRHAICLNVEKGNTAMDLRCQGFADGLMAGVSPTSSSSGSAPPMASSTQIVVSGADLTLTKSVLTSTLAADSAIDGILMSGQSIAAAVLSVLASRDATAIRSVGTFDSNDDVVAAIRSGKMDFGISQQQNLQGWLPVVLQYLHTVTGMLPREPIWYTGPAFITSDTLAQVACVDAPMCPSSSDTTPVMMNGVVLQCPRPEWVGDNYCDEVNNIPGCYDGGDCCASTCSTTSSSSNSTLSTVSLFKCGSDNYNTSSNTYICRDPMSSEMLALQCINNPTLPQCIRVTSANLDTTSSRALIAIAILLITAGAICAALTCYYRHHRVIFSSSPWFLMVVIMGCICTSLYILLAALSHTVATCHAQVWLFNIGFVLATVPLFIKTYRLLAIFYVKQLRSVNVPVWLILGGVVACESLILAIWSGYSGWSLSTSTTSYHECISPDTTAYVTVLVIIKALALVLGSILSYRARLLPSIFNESTYIGFTILNISMVSLIIMLVSVGLRSSISAAALTTLQAAGTAYATGATLLMIFAPKFRQIALGGQILNSGISSMGGVAGKRNKSSGSHNAGDQSARTSQTTTTKSQDLADMDEMQRCYLRTCASRDKTGHQLEHERRIYQQQAEKLKDRAEHIANLEKTLFQASTELAYLSATLTKRRLSIPDHTSKNYYDEQTADTERERELLSKPVTANNSSFQTTPATTTVTLNTRQALNGQPRNRSSISSMGMSASPAASLGVGMSMPRPVPRAHPSVSEEPSMAMDTGHIQIQMIPYERPCDTVIGNAGAATPREQEKNTPASSPRVNSPPSTSVSSIPHHRISSSSSFAPLPYVHPAPLSPVQAATPIPTPSPPTSAPTTTTSLSPRTSASVPTKTRNFI